MTYNEETLFLLSELERFGLSREDVEKEMCYSPNYLGQLLSRQSNEKIVKALKMLLRIKVLEQELGYVKEIPKARSREDDLKEVVTILKEIHASLNQTNASLSEVKHTDLLNQVLLKTSILQSAKVEASITKANPDKIIADLEKVAAKTFDDIHCSSIRENRQNKRYQVDA